MKNRYIQKTFALLFILTFLFSPLVSGVTVLAAEEKKSDLEMAFDSGIEGFTNCET